MSYPIQLKQTVTDTESEESELLALQAAIAASVRPEDLRQGLEAFTFAAMSEEFSAPSGYKFMLEPSPFNHGLVAVLLHFSQKGWHGDHITAIGMRIRGVMETLQEYDWVAVNLLKMSEDHKSFQFDQRLVQAAAAARMRYDTVTQTSSFNKQDFINRLLYLLSNSSS